jgi:uncharacterized membrane protein YsdA (DUF1294 family)
MIKYLLVYAVLINAFGALVFYKDWTSAKKKYKKRVSEKTLHLIELLGGVFGIIFVMLSEGHKSKKKSYFLWTYLIFGIWIVAVYYIFAKVV